MIRSKLESTFQKTHQKHSAMIFSFFRKRLGDCDNALDLTQETFLKVLQFAKENSAKIETILDTPWVMQVARNILNNAKRKREFQFDSPQKVELITTNDPEWGKFSEIEMAAISKEILAYAQEKFTPSEFLVFYKYHIEEKSMRAIAAEVGQSKSNVAALISKKTKEIAEWLDNSEGSK